MKKYYAVRFKGAPDQIRIEKADSPGRAFSLAFGMSPYRIGSLPSDTEYKELGSRLSVIQSDKKRIMLLKDPVGWIEF